MPDPWDREKDKSFLAEAVMEKHSVASTVTVILPSDGSIANAVAQTRLEWIREGKQQSVLSQKYARLYTAAENRSFEVQWFWRDFSCFCGGRCSYDENTTILDWMIIHDVSNSGRLPSNLSVYESPDVRYHGSIDSALREILEQIFSTIAINYSWYNRNLFRNPIEVKSNLW